jgi:hypothetical protein
MGDYEEAVEHPECERRHGEEIHASNRVSVILQKRSPSPRRLWISRSFPHPTQHRSLGDVGAEHLQFTVNARRSPGWILGRHSEDQFTHFLTDALPADGGAVTREPLSVNPEPSTVPANHRFGMHNHERALPTWPKPAEENPEEPVRSFEPRLWMPALQNSKLLPQSQVFKQRLRKQAKRSFRLGSYSENAFKVFPKQKMNSLWRTFSCPVWSGTWPTGT